MMQKKTVTMSDGASMCHSVATDAMMSERQTLQTERVWPIEAESPWHYAQPTLFVSHIHWWCYFSHHLTLGLKGSAAIVTQARAPWHILKWPPALGRGVLTSGFTSFSRCYALHLSISFLRSVLLPPVTVPTPYPPAPTDTNRHAHTGAHAHSHVHSFSSSHLCSSILFLSEDTHVFLRALKIIASDLDSDSISGILQ